MLHFAAVPLRLRETLLDLQHRPALAGFALAGGTSLALRLGHRVSMDLDFFTRDEFDPQALRKQLGMGPESITGQADGTLQLLLNNVKVEFLRHAYPRIAADDQIQDVRMWSLEDVAAMKLNAIVNRGSKKDFYDIVALLDRFPLPEMLEFYRAKYKAVSLMMVIRSLAWHVDADAEPDPVSLRDEPWAAIREKINSAIRSLE